MPSKREILASALAHTGASAVIGSIARWSGVVTLAYHRIGDPQKSQLDRDLFSASQESFDFQMRHLKKHYDVISPADLSAVLDKRAGRHVMVTFDDGYRDNYLAALPVLKTHALTATFFIATSFIDAPRLPWWDEVALMVRSAKNHMLALAPFLDAPVKIDPANPAAAIRQLLRIYKTLPVESTTAFLTAISVATGSPRAKSDDPNIQNLWMTWDDLRAMSAAGMTLGGHTHEHQLMSRMSDAQQVLEVATCKNRIAEETGQTITAFAYPIGKSFAFNAGSRRALSESKISYGFSFYGGHLRHPHADLYDIPRVAVEMDVSNARFKTMMSLPSLLGA